MPQRGLFPVLTIGYMLLVMVLSVLPDHQSFRSVVRFELDPQLQNFLHIPCYGFLVILWLHAWPGMRPVMAGGYVFAYGTFIEAVQFFVPGRFASLLDLIFNGTGVLLGLVSLHLIRRNLNRGGRK